MELSEYIRKACIANVKLSRPFLVAQTGALVFSSHHLHFASNTRADVHDGRVVNENGVRCLCMMRLVETIEQVSVVNLRVRLKHFEWFELEFASADDCANAIYTISKLSRIEIVELTYPFFHVADFEQLDDGWAAFSIEREFAAITKGDPSWRLSEVNVDYAACPSYPRHCVVPANVPDSVLLASSYFRAGNRFPVIAYVHERGSMKEGRRFVPLARASQPLVANGRRSAEDESLLRSILNGAPVGYVVDTRTNAALRNASQRGGGCEIESYYTGWRPEFHAVVDSSNSASAFNDALQRFVDVTNDDQMNASKYLSKLDASGWPRLVHDALVSAVRIGALLDDEGAPVLLHGADGTDSTLLISSLTQLLLSSASRTLRGFSALIDREFVQGGYPFGERAIATGPVTVATPNSVTSVYQATFLLFLDCTWQLTQQFPTVFEFNEQLLFYLAEHSMASEFGTFLVNNERERQRLALAERSVSLWSFVLSSSGTKRFTNAFFSAFHDPLKPCCAPSSYSIWMDMYQRCVIDLHEHHAARDHFSQLKRDYDALRAQYNNICVKRQRVEPSVETSSVDSSDFEKINAST